MLDIEVYCFVVLNNLAIDRFCTVCAKDTLFDGSNYVVLECAVHEV